MRTPFVLAAALLLGTALSACGLQLVNPPHALSDDGGKVVLVDRRIDVMPCTQLGAIQGRASSIFRKDIMTDIQIDARNKAAYNGANRIIKRPSYLLVRNDELSSGVYDMYLCRDNTPPAQEVSPGARQAAALETRG